MEDPEYNLEEWNPLFSLGQNLVDRQGVEMFSPAAVAVAGGLAILAFHLLLPLLNPLLSSGKALSPVVSASLSARPSSCGSHCGQRRKAKAPKSSKVWDHHRRTGSYIPFLINT